MRRVVRGSEAADMRGRANTSVSSQEPVEEINALIRNGLKSDYT
ncbi:hypothetical protein Tco_1552677, partial [Tanacetum coccineum]